MSYSRDAHDPSVAYDATPPQRSWGGVKRLGRG